MAPPRQPAMTMKEWAAGITDIGDSTPSVNLMIYGAPACGKTALLSALPNTLLLGFDPGFATAKSMKRKCKVRPINTERELLAGMDWLEDGGYQEYQWIFADGLSILQTKLTLDSAKNSWLEDNTKRANAFQPDKPDYGRQQNALKVLVARLCDLPANVAFTSHALIGDADDNAEWIRPDIQGREYKVGNFVTGMMSCIGYMAVREKTKRVKQGKVWVDEPTGEMTRRILWEQRYDADTGITTMAKDQLNVFPAVMEVGDAEVAAREVHGLITSIGAE